MLRLTAFGKEVRGLTGHSLRVRDEITGDVLWPILSGENVMGLLKVHLTPKMFFFPKTIKLIFVE